MSNPRIGFVGLGVMGLPMALNLSQAGYSLTVYDKDPAALERAAETIPGVKLAQSPAEVAQASTIVVTMLPSGKYVQEVALGDDGLIHGFGEGALLLDTSSCEPWLTIETAETLAALRRGDGGRAGLRAPRSAPRPASWSSWRVESPPRSSG